MSRTHIDLTGRRFGMLEAIEVTGRAANGKLLWRSRCDCGRERISTSTSLTTVHRSCGCVKSVVPRERRRRAIVEAAPETVVAVEMPKWFGLAPAKLFSAFKITATERGFYAHVDRAQREALQTIIASISARYTK